MQKFYVTEEQAQEYVALRLSIERALRDRQKLDETIRIFAQDDRFCRSCGIETPSDMLLPEIPDFSEGN